MTTGLLSGLAYAKDNRILPEGFDKATADEWVEVHGTALDDADFIGGSDRVRYTVDVAGFEGPFSVDATLRYQPIGYRWAANLEDYDAPEPNRFTTYYASMSADSSVPVARVSIQVD